MKSNCPNEKHPDWINAVNAVGYIDAYRLFVNNGYEIPDITPFRNANDALAYLNKSSLVTKRNGIYYIPYVSPTNFTNRMDSVNKMVDKINTMYGGPVFIIDSHPIENSKYGRHYAYFIDINEQALKDFWQGVTQRDIDSGTMNIDGDILPYDPDIYFQLDGATLDIEDYKDYKRKSEYLLKFFPGYIVIEDWKLPTPAKFDKKARRIYVNPKKLTTDSIGHEFGHILIEEIGGLTNPLVKSAREQLRGHRIESQVFEKYSHLKDVDMDMLDKEVVAQAMGLESVQLFDDELNQAEWVRKFRRILFRIKEVLGINQDAVQKLTRKLVDYNWITETRNKAQQYDAELDSAINNRNVDKIVVLTNKILESLYKKRAIRGRHGIDKKAEELTRLIKEIEKKDSNPIFNLKKFQEFAKKETKAIYLEYLEADRKKKQGESGFSIKMLNKWKNYVAGFSSISDMIDLLEKALVEKEDIEVAEQLQKHLDIPTLDDIRKKHERIERAYLEEGRSLVAKFLSKYSNHISAKYKDLLEEDYNALSKEDKEKISKEDYITNQTEDRMSKHQARTEAYIEGELIRASKDIGTLSRYIDNVLDSPDPVVASMVNAFAQTMRKARLEKYELKDKFVEVLRELEEFQQNKGFFKSEKEFYDFMLEKVENEEDILTYTGHIVGPFSSKFWLDYGTYANKLRRERWVPATFNKKLEQWKNNYAPRTAESEKKYHEDRLKFIKSLETLGELTSADIAKVEAFFMQKSNKALDTIINEESAQKILDWVRGNSWNYRTPIDKYKNIQWLHLVQMAGGNLNMETHDQISAVKENVSNDPRVRFYNFIRNTIDEQQSRVPFAHRLFTRLPGVVKKGAEVLRSGEGIQKGVSMFFKEQFDVLEDEADRGESTVQRELTTEEGKPMLFVPVHFIKRIDPSNQSFDIADIYYRYFSSTIDYSHKQDILPEMEMTRNLLNNREVVRKDSSGNTMIDALRGKTLSKTGLTSQIASQFNDWVEAVVYDKKDLGAGKFKVFGKTFDVSKLIDAMNKYTSLNLLGFNVVQGTANVALGSTMQWIEAFGGSKGRGHYTSKDYLKAKKVYTKHLTGIIGDVGSRKPTNLISLLNREFDTLNDYTGGSLRRDTKFSQLLSSDTLFFTSHAGEHMMQTKVMLAMLNNLEAKQEDQVIGKMLDMFSVEEDKLVLDPRVTNFGENDRAIFENKVKRVLSSMHGEYSDLGRVAIQRYAVGRMAFMFRKFVVPGAKRRYSKEHVNNLSGEVIEGTYRTTARFLGNLVKDFNRYKFSVLTTDWNNLKAREQAAIIKTIGEVSFLLAAGILIGALEGGEDDDKWLRNFLAYQAYRFRTEITFFINPGSTMQILRSPAASMSLIENTFKFTGEIFKALRPEQLGFDEYERGNWKGRKKITKHLINFIPGWRQLARIRYIDDQISWLKN